MARKESQAPYAPWADADAPVECSHGDHDEPTTCAECMHRAGYKSGSDGSREHVHADFETALQWSTMDPKLSTDLVYVQYEEDPFVFVDGDDVRGRSSTRVAESDARFVDAAGLTEMLRYAVDCDAAAELCKRYLGPAPGEDGDSLSKTAPVITHVTRRTAGLCWRERRHGE